MLEDYLARQPVAVWNTARGVWEKNQMNLLCGHLEPFLETWPISGMMHAGRVYGLQMPVRPITVSESSLLRTPVADETGGGAVSPAMAKAKGQTLRLTGQIIDLVEPGRLPTPTVADQFTGSLKSSQQSVGSLHSVSLAQIFQREDLFPTPNTMDMLPARTPEKLAESKQRKPGGYSNLREYVVNNLPTPTTRDHKDGSIAPAKHRPNDTDTLSRALYHNGTDWGRFSHAIEKWENILGRSAPKPTEPTGRDGQQQLSARFTEWMMGVPEGWITSPEIGLTRNEALKACGNGVVPQQAVLALEMLLEGIEL